MFHHTITIYRHTVQDGADVYTKQVIDEVYWFGGAERAGSGKGVEGSIPTTIITSPELAWAFGTAWNAAPGDIVIKGEGPDITSLKQIQGGITVMRVEENVCGSTVDNITITGK